MLVIVVVRVNGAQLWRRINEFKTTHSASASFALHLWKTFLRDNGAQVSARDAPLYRLTQARNAAEHAVQLPFPVVQRCRAAILSNRVSPTLYDECQVRVFALFFCCFVASTHRFTFAQREVLQQICFSIYPQYLEWLNSRQNRRVLYQQDSSESDMDSSSSQQRSSSGSSQQARRRRPAASQSDLALDLHLMQRASDTSSATPPPPNNNNDGNNANKSESINGNVDPPQDNVRMHVYDPPSSSRSQGGYYKRSHDFSSESARRSLTRRNSVAADFSRSSFGDGVVGFVHMSRQDSTDAINSSFGDAVGMASSMAVSHSDVSAFRVPEEEELPPVRRSVACCFFTPAACLTCRRT